MLLQQFTVKFSLPLFAACTTTPILFAIFRFKSQVATKKRVPVFAVRFFSILSRNTITSKYVYLVADLLQMARSNASAIMTQMVAYQANIRRFCKEVVEHTVCRVVMPVQSYFSVSVIDKASLPLPAGSSLVRMFGTDFDLRKKADEKMGIGMLSGNIKRNHFSLLYRLNLIRLVGLLTQPCEPIFILTHDVLP